MPYQWSSASHPYLKVPARRFSPEEKRFVIEQIFQQQRMLAQDQIELRRSIRFDRKQEASLRMTRAILGRLKEVLTQWREKE